MNLTTKLNLSNREFKQTTGSTLNLSGDTYIYGDLRYGITPILTGDTQIVTKGFVDNALSGFGSITGGTNGLNTRGKNIRLGGTLTGATTIGLGINNLILTGSTGTLRYGGDYSSNYTARSLVDKGYVDSIAFSGGTPLLGSTSTLGTETWLGTDLINMGNASSNNTIFIGTYAGQGSTGATGSIIIGTDAGGSSINASESIFIGISSGTDSANAYNSNFIGYQSGYQALNAANSIFIGRYSGFGDSVDNATSSGTSILIGDNTNTGGFSNSIAIGANATNTMTNQFVIGSTYTNWQIAGVDYVMPASLGGSGTVLTDVNGDGNLTWEIGGSGGGWALSGNTILTGPATIIGAQDYNSGLEFYMYSGNGYTFYTSNGGFFVDAVGELSAANLYLNSGYSNPSATDALMEIHKTVSGDTYRKKIQLYGSSSGITVGDSYNNKGFVYQGNYSEKYTYRSIPDVEYVRKNTLNPVSPIFLSKTYNNNNLLYTSQLDLDTNIEYWNNPQVNDETIYFAILQTGDSKIILGGNVTRYSGQTVNGLFRVNSDLTYDNTFTPPTFTSTSTGRIVYDAAIQSDGKIVVVGDFTHVNGSQLKGVARLNTDGSVAGGFNPQSGITVTGSTRWATAVTIQPDGKILVGGNFSHFNGHHTNGLVRLNTNGNRDTDFSVGTGFRVNQLFNQPNTLNIGKIVVQSGDSKIIVVGSFVTFSGATANHIVRLNTNGGRDTSFNSTTFSNATYMIYDVVIQAGGNYIVSPDANVSFRRLNNDGTINGSYTNYSHDGPIKSTILTSDNKVITAGQFGGFNNPIVYNNNNIGKFAFNGDPVDDTFIPGHFLGYEESIGYREEGRKNNSVVNQIIELLDGTFLVVGSFKYYSDTLTRNVAILDSGVTLRKSTIKYGEDVSDYYTSRSIPDVDFVTGITSQLTGLISSSFPMGISSASIITTGAKGRYTISYSGRIVGWRLVSDLSTNTVLDIWKTNNAIPTNGNSIFGTKPILSDSEYEYASGLSIPVVSGDVFILEVESNTVAKYLRIELLIIPTS